MSKPSYQYNFTRVTKEKVHSELLPLNIETMQINLTKLCNQACVHCHVDSSPRRREFLEDDAFEACLSILQKFDEIKKVDLTGGAPELHPRFCEFVSRASKLGKHIMVRHNLTVTLDRHPVTKESMEYLPEFFKKYRVEVISSLPCYTEELTNRQRGDGVFNKSIESLKMLNKQGFGEESGELILNLVYNPVGTHLPPDQQSLEVDYKRELFNHFGIKFNNLFVVTNMPIHRFKVQLIREKKLDEYMIMLVNSYNPDAAEGVMCRSMISIDHRGNLYDCDFNQMFDMNIMDSNQPITVFNFDRDKVLSRKIRFADHCFGCTAGAGSSCGGVLS